MLGPLVAPYAVTVDEIERIDDLTGLRPMPALHAPPCGLAWLGEDPDLLDAFQVEKPGVWTNLFLHAIL